MSKKITLLGSTGSIGGNTLAAIRSRRRECVVLGLSCARNIKTLAEQAQEFRPPYLAVLDEASAAGLRKLLPTGYTPEILVGSELMEVASAAAGAAGAATITVKDSPATTPAASTVIYPGEGGAKGRDVYSTLIVGADAYGVTELEGGGLQHIVKQLGSSGTADPLNQRATAGWKLTKVAERLVEQYMVRIESASTFESGLMN